MDFNFPDNKLTILLTSLYQSIQNEGEDCKSVEIQKELDVYIKLICAETKTTPPPNEMLNLRKCIETLYALAEQKRLKIGNEILKQKQNSKAIAKYRSV